MEVREDIPHREGRRRWLNRFERGVKMEKKTTKVILNESHSLMEDQVRVLDEKFGEGNWEILPVPAEGWTLSEMREVAHSLKGDVVFASPVPVLLSILSRESGAYYERMVEGLDHPRNSIAITRVLVLHNDRRDAKEIRLPNGETKLVHTVAKTGWTLV